jgi:hypothetical protein
MHSSSVFSVNNKTTVPHHRLNSSSPGPPSSTKQSTPAATASAESSGSGSRKRKIVESEEVSSCYVSDQYAATAAGKVGVEIHSIDPEGTYVRLFNNTDKVCSGEFTICICRSLIGLYFTVVLQKAKLT